MLMSQFSRNDMKKIEYFKINKHLNYVLLVSNDDLYFLYDQIKKKTKNGQAAIIVDMFYRNGFSFNRFIELNYSYENKVISRIINPREVSEEIKINTNVYFNNHFDLLDKSTLSKSIKNFVLINKT